MKTISDLLAAQRAEVGRYQRPQTLTVHQIVVGSDRRRRRRGYDLSLRRETVRTHASEITHVLFVVVVVNRARILAVAVSTASSILRPSLTFHTTSVPARPRPVSTRRLLDRRAALDRKFVVDATGSRIPTDRGSFRHRANEM